MNEVLGEFTVPAWADAHLSAALPEMRAQGEGAQMEYISKYPEQAHELAKEIAAFASTAGGTILLGVENNGDLVGLKDAASPLERDGLMRRVENLCSGPIRPAITPSVHFAVEADLIVMVINVPRGRQPLYYSNRIPYIRHVSSSRGTEPHEVIERVADWLAANPRAAADGNTIPDWFVAVTDSLITVETFAPEVENREFDPWLSQWMAEFGAAGAQIREALNSGEIPSDLAASLKDIARRLDEAANFRIYLGSGPSLRDLVAQIRQDAETLWEQSVKPSLVQMGGARPLRASLEQDARKLNDLAERAVDMVNRGQTDELQAEVSAVGRDLIHAARLYAEGDEMAAFEDVGHRLHLVETIRMYADGGQSYDNLLTHIGQLRDRVLELLETNAAGGTDRTDGEWLMDKSRVGWALACVNEARTRLMNSAPADPGIRTISDIESYKNSVNEGAARIIHFLLNAPGIEAKIIAKARAVVTHKANDPQLQTMLDELRQLLEQDDKDLSAGS
jgi:ATP-dependent DNA helicase RecG